MQVDDMAEFNNIYERKYHQLINYLDALRESRCRDEKNAYTMRGWCLTVIIGYLALLKDSSSDIYTLVIVCFAFFYLEGFIRYRIKRNQKITSKVLDVLNMDGNEFNEALRKFRPVRPCKDRKRNIYWYSKALKVDLTSMFWYGALLLCSIIVCKPCLTQFYIVLAIVAPLIIVTILLVKKLHSKYSWYEDEREDESRGT